MTGRHYRAWALARRIRPRRSGAPGAAHWAALVSVWLHLGALGVALLARAPAVEAPTRLVVVERVADGDVAAPGAPAPAAEPARDDVRVARTDPAQASPVPPERWDAESRHDTVADASRRAPVTSERAGPLLPRSAGAAEEAGGRTPDPRPGDDAARAGNRPDADDGPIVVGGGGGGADGAGTARGARSAGGRGDECGPAGGGGRPVAARAERYPDGEDRGRISAPEGWDPTVARIEIAIPGIARGAGRAAEDRVGRRTSRGGQDLDLGGVALPTPAARHPGTRRVAAPGTADPAEELRIALGFGPIDRTALTPRPAWAGTSFGQGRTDSSPQTALDVPVAWQTSVSTRGTALGAWVEDAEAIVAERWRALDLDPHARAIGIAGDVTVRWRARRDGSVEDVVLVRSSGNAALDAMAIRAVPDRLPRFPAELAESAIYQQITLHYRNPLVPFAPR